jgi:uncharacterized protein (DUF433 family)
MKPTDYAESRDGGWYVRGSRVSIESLAEAFRDGLSPEAMARECFPTLSLEQVYGAVAFYLAHRAEFEASCATLQAEGEAWRAAQREAEPGFAEKMARARRELLAARR